MKREIQTSANILGGHDMVGDHDLIDWRAQDWLAARSQATPQSSALIIGNRQWTYAELSRLVDQFAAALNVYTKSKERVAVLLPNNLAYVCLVHAAARMGTILVPLNRRLSNTELAWQIRHAGCSTLVYDENTAGKVDQIKIDSIQTIETTELFTTTPAKSKVAFPPHKNDAVYSIMFTSGTTGEPKGAMLTYANHFYSAIASSYRLGVMPDDKWLCCLPLYHVGGLAIILRSCLYGTAVELHDGFDVAAICRSLDKGEVTLISLVPTMLQRILAYRGDRPWPSSFRHVLLGAAAVPPDLLARCNELGIPVSVTYGLTEAASQVATMLPDDCLEKPGSAGKPLLFTRITIIDDAGQKLQQGEIGEIVVKGPTTMAGYNKDPENSARVLVNGWLHTGDLGYLDQDGDLWVLQRRQDLIITGGENVYPAQVESVLRSHPAVDDICVVGIDDEEWGQRVAAAIVIDEAVQFSKDALIAYGRQHLAGYKLPSRIVVLSELPRTPSGKVKRKAVASHFSETMTNAQNDS